ncbi:MAG TPA: hypothetical protein VF235_03020 [Actinomycetota bacterium]
MTDEPREPEEASAARQAAEEPEPDWAEEIRALRRARGERLKSLLGTEDEAKEQEEGTEG